jgi:hypothetical protein
MRKPRGSETPKGPAVIPDGHLWVCEEYELQGNQVVAAFDSDALGRWSYFKPLEEAPDLFLQFSRLSQERDFAQAALSFSRKYGLPTTTTGYTRSDQLECLSLRRFFQESQRA